MQHVGVQSLLKVHIKNKTYLGANGVETQALKDAELTLTENSFTVFFGPSGCGKSTLLRILAGLDSDYEGEVHWAHPPKVGMVFQEPRLLPWRTVKENILLSADPTFSEQDFSQLVEVMGLTEMVSHFPGELSLGLSRRVAIARAFASKPNLLLLDEPFVSLDAPTAARLRQLVRTLWVDNPITAVMVTHDMREAVELGEEVLLFTARPGSIHDRLTILPTDRTSEATIEAKRSEVKSLYPHLFET
ncbi:MAG: ABC transporter ATP-binding protein [Rhizobiales bacterium]|nr:ABC transporter ATP-binding protein [Hyphomicrobiales bacterium]